MKHKPSDSELIVFGSEKAKRRLAYRRKKKFENKIRPKSKKR